MVTAGRPATGPAAGGAQVTITGQNLAFTSQVHFGPNFGTPIHCANQNSCTVTAPPGQRGKVAVQVITGGGPSAITKATYYTYQ